MLIRLSLSHFRSHRAAELSFDGRPVAIFGPNGAGKTNLIEAISMLSPGRGLRGAAGEDLARGPERIGWKISAEFQGLDGLHLLTTRGEGAGRRVEIDGKASPQAGLGRVLRLIWLTPAMDRLWMEGAAERRRFLDRISLSLFPDHAEAAQLYDRALRERNRLIKDDIHDESWLGALEERLAAEGARLRANRAGALMALEAVAEGEFPRAALTLEIAGPEGAEALREGWRAGRARDFAAGRTLIGPHRDDLGAVYAAKGMAARLCSTGEQKALLINVMLANGRAVAARFGTPPILLLDEVAAHLDEGRRGRLYEAILGLGAQAFLTGTGPELFESLRGIADFREVGEAEGESRVGPG